MSQAKRREGRIRVLVTNDDGIHAPGLLELVRALVRTELFDVRVSAPKEEQSAVSHRITVRECLFAQPVHFDEDLLRDIIAFGVEGSPVDSCRLGLIALFPDWRPDAVVSGINKGGNAGLNTLYSGTVAAALEASMLGFRAMAVSLNHPSTYPSSCDEWNYAEVAPLCVPFLQSMVDEQLSPSVTLNVNFPNPQDGPVRGVRMARQGGSVFSCTYHDTPPPHGAEEGGRRAFMLRGAPDYSDADSLLDGNDIHTLRSAMISVTPLGLSLDLNAPRRPWDDILRWPLFESYSLLASAAAAAAAGSSGLDGSK